MPEAPFLGVLPPSQGRFANRPYGTNSLLFAVNTGAGLVHENHRQKKHRRSGVFYSAVQESEAGALDGLAPFVDGFGTKLLFDAQQLVVLADAVGARKRTGLDLPGSGTHGQIGDEGVFRFT